MKIVILAAHPDDEVLGCGATAARLSAEGNEVVPVIFCENATVRYNQSMQQTIEEWSRQSAKILGMSEPVFMRLADQKLDAFSSLEMAQMLDKIIAELQPEVIFTHHGGDLNKDHRLIFEATMVAVRPLPESTVRALYTYETISSTEWAATEFYPAFQPSTFYDVTRTLRQKIEAFSCYQSEVKEYPHPRSLEAIENRAKDWGARIGCRAAEAFQLVRAIL